MKIKLKYDNKNYTAFFSFMYFSISNISRMLNLIGVPREVSYSIFILLFIKYVFTNKEKIKRFDLIVWPLLCIGPLIGLVFNYQYISTINIFAILILYIPAYYYFRTCPLEDMEQGVIWSAYYSAAYLIIYFIIYVYGTDGYDMSYGYWAAFPICILSYYVIKGKLINLVLIIPLLLSVLLYGSRGSLALSVLCILYYWIIPKELNIKTSFKIGIIVLIIFIVYQNFYTILISLTNSFGIGSRNITKLLNQNFLASTRRDTLYQICQNLISARPLGYGVLSSRRLLIGYPYPHSLLYELQLDYGQILGYGIVVVIIVITVLMLLKSKKYDELSCIIGYVCFVGVLSLFVSSSIYYEYCVPSVIAFFVRDVMYKNRNMELAN